MINSYLSTPHQHLLHGGRGGLLRAWPCTWRGQLLSLCTQHLAARCGWSPAQTQLSLELTRPSRSPAAGTPPLHLSGPSRHHTQSPTAGYEGPRPSQSSGWSHSPAGAGLVLEFKRHMQVRHGKVEDKTSSGSQVQCDGKAPVGINTGI